MRCNIITPGLKLTDDTVVQFITRRGGLRSDPHINGKDAFEMRIIANRLLGLKEMPPLAKNILLEPERLKEMVEALKAGMPNLQKKYNLNPDKVFAELHAAFQGIETNGEELKNLETVHDVTMILSLVFSNRGDSYLRAPAEPGMKEIVGLLEANESAIASVFQRVVESKATGFDPLDVEMVEKAIDISTNGKRGIFGAHKDYAFLTEGNPLLKLFVASKYASYYICSRKDGVINAMEKTNAYSQGEVRAAKLAWETLADLGTLSERISDWP